MNEFLFFELTFEIKFHLAAKNVISRVKSLVDRIVTGPRILTALVTY